MPIKSGTKALDENLVPPVEEKSHSFIVRIWLEEAGKDEGSATWHGYIQHALSRKKQVINNLNDIVLFIIPYLQQMGLRLGLAWRIRQWLKRRRSRNT